MGSAEITSALHVTQFWGAALMLGREFGFGQGMLVNPGKAESETMWKQVSVSKEVKVS
jgi:hypothetical protein